ncbi:hypothetical protein, partial [Escherichia coli]|uniref:hypothetical protein n=1 Tax=Escherichia coli TaxID=562 RepID=UPI00195394F9
VLVNALPAATISGNATVCFGSTSPQISFTGLNGTAPYTFTYKMNGGANQTIVSSSGNTASVSVPTTVAGSFIYALVSVQEGSGNTCVN